MMLNLHEALAKVKHALASSPDLQRMKIRMLQI